MEHQVELFTVIDPHERAERERREIEERLRRLRLLLPESNIEQLMSQQPNSPLRKRTAKR
jgi:hypothetical protein